MQNRTHGPVHEILTAGGQSDEHDAKGNMTSIPSSRRPTASRLSLKWDFDNKLRAADTDDNGTDGVFYRWDALGRRVGRDDGTNHSIYFQDGQQTLADYPAGTAAGSPTYNYVFASYIDEIILRTGSGGNRFNHRNGQSSITALTDGGGSVVERYAYTAYGQVTILDSSLSPLASRSSNNRYTYTGREWDSGLSLYHYRARMYDPVAGRFVSRDPIGFRGGLNLFCCVNSRSVSFLDPFGLADIRIDFYWGFNDPLGPRAFSGMENGSQAFDMYYADSRLAQRDTAIKIYREQFAFFISKLDECCKKYCLRCPGERAVK